MEYNSTHPIEAIASLLKPSVRKEDTMPKQDQREAMTEFLNTFGRGERGGRGDFLADDVASNHWRWGYSKIEGKENLENQYLKSE